VKAEIATVKTDAEMRNMRLFKVLLIRKMFAKDETRTSGNELNITGGDGSRARYSFTKTQSQSGRY